MEDELRVAIEKYAKTNSIDRTAAIKEMCREILGLSAGGAGKRGKAAKGGKGAGKRKGK